jgi:AcrR family transcriptional regulator
MTVERSDVTAKRAYLRPDDRRRQLLEAASRVFLRDGLAGLTMVALAKEADASRQLVYDHFGDLGSLYEAFFEDRASQYLAAIDEVEHGPDPAGPADAAVGRFQALLLMPTEDLRAIRLVIADTSTPELDGVRARLRRRLERHWLGPATALGVDRKVARAMIWTLMSAFLALADLVDRREIDAARATSIVNDLVTALSAGTRSQGRTTP